ncbi:MAG: LacI family DNA-binding transcriptional regulator [Oliverpabstia sp.]
MQKVRQSDIAAKLGVSTVTVHNALCGRKGVSDEMRARIQETAKEMGYEPAMKAKKKDEKTDSWKIGVIIAENYLAQYSTYYWKMYQELALAATEKRCFTTIEVLKKHAEKVTFELPEAVKERAVDGMIVIGEIDMRYIRILQKNAGMPIVFLDFYNNEIAKDAVIADNFYGMYQMTELLFEQGLERLAYVGSIFATSSIMDRYCGFMKAILEHHKTLPAEWLIEDRDEMGQVGFELPKCMPDAFVCNCDLVAGILIQKLEAAGYRVPEDVSVVGFDNFVSPGFIDTKVTTYEVNMKAMTKVALDKLIKQLKASGRGRTLEVVSGHICLKKSIKIK